MARPLENDHRFAPHAVGLKHRLSVDRIADVMFARHPQANVAGLDNLAEQFKLIGALKRRADRAHARTC